MKKRLWAMITLLFMTGCLAGCQTVGDKATSPSIIYGIAASLSLLLLIGCCLLVKQKKAWFVLLFSSVMVVNIGYTLLSVSSCLSSALWANRLSYLGSVFLPFAMLMIILNATNTPWKKWLPISLGVLSVIVFLIAASPGILDIYYKEVCLDTSGGFTTLRKVYGSWHFIFLVYLFGYFAAMTRNSSAIFSDILDLCRS